MKRLFKIGIGLFIYSIIPILSWIVLSYILNDNRIANVFSITYALQFVWSILRAMFGTGANIRKEKENNNNSIWNSIFWGTIVSAIIFAIPIIFVDNYIAFFGQDVEFYRNFVIFSIGLLFLQTLFSFIIEKLYFEDRENLANIHLFAFNLTTFLSLIVLCLVIPNTLIALLVTLGILLIYVIALYIWQFQKFKINLSFFKNFKYESANIVQSIFMLIIYLFGYKNAFSAGAEYLVALNIIALSTDTQWDMLYAISTVTKVDISKNRFEYKKTIKASYAYTVIVTLSCVVMATALVFANNVVFEIAICYLVFQIVDMLLFPYKTILSCYTQLEYSATLNTSINFALKCLRTILSIFIISPFCTEIGQIVSGALGFIVFAIIRIVKYKVDGNTITIKNKTISE